MGLLRSFTTDDRANVAMIFALCAIPLFGAVGVGIDYTRAATARTRLQAGIDAAVLSVAKEAARLTPAQIEQRARIVFDAHFGTVRGATLTSFTAVKQGKTVRVTAAGTMPTYIASVLGRDSLDFGSQAVASFGTRRIELALVLDNTGSMGWSNKMVELKRASLNLVAALQAVSLEPGAIKISIVPFDTQVNVGSANRAAPWLAFGALNPAAWNGCVTDRDQPWDTTDEAPNRVATLYPAVMCGTGSLAALRPLTDDWAALRTTVNAMTPSGYTNLTMGLAWGMATLSRGEPLMEATPDGTPDVQKFMIVLTDGDNTRNRWSTDSAAIDARSRLACTELRRKPIKVYTVRVIEGNAALLRDCASNPSMYKEVNQASELDAVFRAIANEISAIRLTS